MILETKKKQISACYFWLYRLESRTVICQLCSISILVFSEEGEKNTQAQKSLITPRSSES